MADFSIPLDKYVAYVKPIPFLLIEKPDWSTWRYILKERLFACVALSCEVTPHDAGRYIKHPKLYDEDGKGLPIKLCTFRDRLEVAIANLSPNGPLKPISEHSEGEAINAEIYLADFADFAESIGWILPDEFPRKPTVRNTKLSTNASVKPGMPPQTEPDPKALGEPGKRKHVQEHRSRSPIPSAVDGRPAERQRYLREIWDFLDKPGRNSGIWKELSKRKGKEGCPVTDVQGNVSVTWVYGDGRTETVLRHKLETDMSIVRKTK